MGNNKYEVSGGWKHVRARAHTFSSSREIVKGLIETLIQK